MQPLTENERYMLAFFLSNGTLSYTEALNEWNRHYWPLYSMVTDMAWKSSMIQRYVFLVGEFCSR